ncbi:MAG TPA: NADP-dependent malic enzyme [Candidatus Saccharimonadales bacterium]|nr:NADP-dependent malic enzyme [Candidatus Saccharimonadales bacterium]
MDINKHSLEAHKKLRGKISVKLKDQLDSKLKLSTYYTPGVAAVSTYLSDYPNEARNYTWLNNSVAVVSDGSAVLGLGNIGPIGALPVMEGKCMLFKEFAGIDAIPIVLNVHSADEIVDAVTAIAPSFGGINLEDIAAPICFEVEQRLKQALAIPLMHDDQHGTAVVVLAGLINASKITGKKLGDCSVVVIGAGAAGVAVSKLLHEYAEPNITVIDSKGIISNDRDDLSSVKHELASYNSKKYKTHEFSEAIAGADILIGVSKPGIVSQADIKSMAKNPIVFAMANPVPEIMPDEAYAAGAAIVATGRSDFPNQVNNVLAFPGIFRGALDNQVKHITEKHKVAAAEALAALVKHPTKDKIIPSVFDREIVPAISAVIT